MFGASPYRPDGQPCLQPIIRLVTLIIIICMLSKKVHFGCILCLSFRPDYKAYRYNTYSIRKDKTEKFHQLERQSEVHAFHIE